MKMVLLRVGISKSSNNSEFKVEIDLPPFVLPFGAKGLQSLSNKISVEQTINLTTRGVQALIAVHLMPIKWNVNRVRS